MYRDDEKSIVSIVSNYSKIVTRTVETLITVLNKVWPGPIHPLIYSSERVIHSPLWRPAVRSPWQRILPNPSQSLGTAPAYDYSWQDTTGCCKPAQALKSERSMVDERNVCVLLCWGCFGLYVPER